MIGVTLETMSEPASDFLLAFSWHTCPWGSQLMCCDDGCQAPPWRGPYVGTSANRLLQTLHSTAGKEVLLETYTVALDKPVGECGPSQHIDFNVMKDPAGATKISYS